MLLQILAVSQVQHKELPTLKELGDACGVSADAAGMCIEQLVAKNFLAVGERKDENGFPSNYFDLKPLWQQLEYKAPEQEVKRVDAVSLFEAEFGRPLSGFECEQIRQWLERDQHPEWMITEALREAVLTNKYSFKYIDRVLYDWNRNHVRTKQELDSYRQSYRERTKGREESAASLSSASRRKSGSSGRSTDQPMKRDERYSAFYHLFPDS